MNVGSFIEEVKVFSGGELSPGSRRVEFSPLVKGRAGRPVHVTALMLYGEVQLSTVLATMPAVMPSHLLASVISNIRLRSAGHDFIRNMDGLDVLDAASFRTRRDLSAPGSSYWPSDIPDADGTVTEGFAIYIPLCRPRERGSMRFDGAIPLEMLDERRNAEHTLSFDIAATLRAFPGVTVDALTSLAVHAECIALDDMRFPAPWQWRIREQSQNQFIHQMNGPIEFYGITGYDRGGDTQHGARSVAHYSDLHLRVGDEVIRAGDSPADVAYAQILEGFAYPDGTARDPSQGTLFALPLIGPQPVGAFRTKMPVGDCAVQFTSSNDADYGPHRFLSMTTGVRTRAYDEAVKRAVGAPADAIIASVHAKAKRGGPASPILDATIGWPGMPYAVPASRFGR